MKKIYSLFVALLTVVSLSAENYFLKSTWGQGEASWKQMTMDDEDWFSLADEIFDGKDFAINTSASDEGARVIKAANVQGSINTDDAELSAGDSVLFIFRPSLVNQYDEKESGLFAMITKKNGFAIRGTWGEKLNSWKNLEQFDEESFFVQNVLFDGQNVQILAGNEIYTIKPENIQALMASDYSEAVLEAGDIVLFSFTPDARSAYDETQSGLMALIFQKHGYALENSWGEGLRTWKNMTVDPDDADWYALDFVKFEGRDVAINNFAGSLGARTIKLANIKAYIDGEEASMVSGDSVHFVYRPSLYNRYDETESGLHAIIFNKNGYAIKCGNVWKNMTMDPEDDDWFVLENVRFDGKDVKLVHGNEIKTIKPENIKAYINYDAAQLSEGDSVVFIFRPSLVNQYDEKESGLYAMITKKNGYAIRGTWGEDVASWKNMESDGEGAFIVENVLFDGQNVQVINGKEIYNIKPENIKADDYSGEEVVLEAGDKVIFVFDPDTRSAYDETKSGLWAVILKKHGYALQGFFGEQELSWKELEDAGDGQWVLMNSIFDGSRLAVNNFASKIGARDIEAKNVQGFINSEFAELSAGDSVIFIYAPEEYSSYEPAKSGLSAMITKKNGYAIKCGDVWKNMTVDPEDDDWYTLENVRFDGKNVQIVHGNEIMTIKPENINAYINYDAAQLSEGDSVVFIFRPSLVNKFNEKESGLQALITKKNGYAIHGTWGEEFGSWKNMESDGDGAFIVENVMFDGQNVQVIFGNEIYNIKPENIKADDYSGEDVELEAGDIVIFVFDPDTRSAYDETKSGLWAVILEKHGYALKTNFGEGVEWKQMIKQDEDTYIIENVEFDGHDVELNNFVGDLGARKIKVANIKAYLVDDYSEATLEKGDLVVFMYTPSAYNRYDETQSGLSAIIIKKHEGEGISTIYEAENQAVKTIVNGHVIIIKNGKIFHVNGTEIR